MPPSVGQASGEEGCSRRSCSEHAAITGMDSADCTSGYQPCEFDSLLDAFLILITCRAYLRDIVVFSSLRIGLLYLAYPGGIS